MLSHLSQKLAKYDHAGLHYDLVAKAIYATRPVAKAQLLERNFLRHVVAGLIAFDMGRMIGAGADRYDFEKGFAARLSAAVSDAREHLIPLLGLNLMADEPMVHAAASMAVYERFARTDLDVAGKAFDVGATKVLHFLNPWFFPIIDSNAAAALRQAGKIAFRKSTTPGYGAERYVEAQVVLKAEMLRHGHEVRKAARAQGLPELRIVDKALFVSAQQEWKPNRVGGAESPY
jgi:hypothetical protein